MIDKNSMIGDLHIHSRFSRACSTAINFENLVKWAKIKGLHLLGTSDFTHPIWLQEIKDNLVDNGNGFYFYKDFPFIISGEVSLIYTQERGRRIHLVLLVPSIEVAEKINSYFDTKGRRDYDGRPIFKIPGDEFVREMMKISPGIEIIPAHCLLGESVVHANYSLKKIKNIKKGDLVYTHNNRWQKVTNIFSRKYSGKLYKIKPWCWTNGLETTPEHPFYAIKSYKCSWIKGLCKESCSKLDECKNKRFEKYFREWVPASELKVGDFLVYPRFNKTDDMKFIKGRKLTKEFCRLIGYYLAEGYTIREEGIGFSFNKNEYFYIGEVIEFVNKIFGKSKFKIDARKGSDIIFYSKELNKFFKQFYNSKIKRAHTKSLPLLFLELPRKKQVEIFRGWYRGDKGYTVSKELMNQMKIICLRLGIIPNISIDKSENHKKRGNHFHLGREIKANHDIYSLGNLSFFEDRFELLNEIEFTKFKTKIKKRHGWVDEDYIYLPIRKIEVKDFDDFVYNLEVENDNSYVTEFACVHNCWTPWFGIFGSMSGFDSLKECFKDEVENVHAIETGMSCYDKETDILTEKGWKKFENVEYTDRVCTLNTKTNNIKFQKPTKIQNYDYKGKMYRLKTKRVDLLVTPNHNLLVSHCDFRKKPNFSLKDAETIFNKSKRLKKDGIWVGADDEYFILPAVKIKHGSKYYSGFRDKGEKKFPIKYWLKFFGFFIAEGWTTYEQKGNRYGVYLCNKDKKIMKEMKTILQNFGYNPYEYLNRGITTLRVSNYQLYSYLKKFGKCWEKFIPLEIKELSKDLLGIFLEYYIKGDGNVYGRNNKGLRATTTSIKLRDDLQEIALKLGMSAYYKLHNKKGTLFNSPCYGGKKKYYQRNDSWTVHFIRKNIHTVMPSTIRKNKNYIELWVDFDGRVYCVSVPNKIIYVRRNGIPAWCGNSDPDMNWKIKELENKSIVSFSDAHSFWPFRLGREATIFRRCESYSGIIQQIRENSFIATVETDPAYGKYHWDGHRSCGFSCSPEKTKEIDSVCPICNKNLIIGVESRVGALENAESDHKLKKPFYKLLPLHEIISLCFGMGMQSKKVWGVYNDLIANFENEFNILLNVLKEEFLEKGIDEKLVGLILRNREGKIKVQPGFDGEYGVAKMGEASQKDLSKFF